MSKHIFIIGSGVIGLSTAYYLVQRGHRVTIADRMTPDHDGCSYGNAGMVVPSHFIPLAAPGMVALGLKWMWNPESPFYIKPRLDWDLWSWGWKLWRAANAAHVARSAPLLRDLGLAGRACFEDLAALPGNDFGLVKKGLLMLCKSQHRLDEEGRTAAQARQLGIPAEVLDAKQTADLEPNVRMDIAGSVYFPKDCHLSPARFMAGLRALLEKAGATFAWNVEVTGWRVSGHRIGAVRTSQGDFAADEYVLCGGAWSPVVARDLQLNLPMQAGKGYSLTVPHPRQCPQICSIFTEARLAVTPIAGTLRFAGTMEIAGLNEDINPLRVQGIIKSVPKYYPDFTPDDFRDLPVWRGLRPCSPDGLPYVGRPARYSNLGIATGHAMMGLSLGPITGKLMAEILSGEKPSIGIGLLNPDRYAQTGRLGAYLTAS
ncbi:MAG: FAD-dependent oxidoreductase [Verrucomicrobiota bacterium]